jgi:uncharacterized protein
MLPTRIAVAGLDIYRGIVSPLLPRSCRFAPTCSEYARRAILEHGVRRGLWLTGARLLKCHPFHPGGWDPPPTRHPSA